MLRCELRMVLQLLMFLFLIYKTGAEQDVGRRNKLALKGIQMLHWCF